MIKIIVSMMYEVSIDNDDHHYNLYHINSHQYHINSHILSIIYKQQRLYLTFSLGLLFLLLTLDLNYLYISCDDMIT